jgi:hypothetical protein
MKHLSSFSLIIGLLLLSTGRNYAQVNVKDSTLNVAMIHAAFGSWVPAGDLGERFGVFFSAGPGFTYKSKGNWVFSASFDYLFGNVIKNRDSLFRYIQTSHGFIIDGEGLPADVSVQMRGYKVTGRFGKLIPLAKTNPNSGLLLMAGGGYLIHKIDISVLENMAPQLRGDYAKGYDRLTAGFTANQFVGYQHLSNKRKINFFVGLEITEAFTKSQRDYDFDRMAPDTKNRLDIMVGIRAGWILPLYGRAPRDYYYY